MKQIPTDTFTFTEIGGVGEMIYKAVRFPDYVPEYDHAKKENVIIPLLTGQLRPESGTDHNITGQELLASLCNLYKKVNAPDSEERIDYLVWGWCRSNIHPYDIEELCLEIEEGDFMDGYFVEHLQRLGTFEVREFLDDLCRLGTVFEYYDALQKNKYGSNPEVCRNLYYEGRVCDSIRFFEQYRVYKDDAEYLHQIRADYGEHMDNIIYMFPDFKLRLKRDRKTEKVEMGADIRSVFDIAWYAFARMVADVAPPADVDPNYMYAQGSILTCMACGEYFVRHSSRQRYCDNPNCQAERNNRKARAYYKRKKASDS